MSLNRHKAMIGLVAVLAHPAGWTQPSATTSLLEQGRYWQSQGDNKRAAQAWEKLLLADPQQPEALYGLGLVAVRDKRLDEANTYLARLRTLEPQGRFTQQLQQDISITGSTADDIDRARILAASGETEKAVDILDKVLQGRKPQGDLALDYYAWLGYSPKGLPGSIAGLRQLLMEHPNDAKIELALAKHLLRDETLRPEGVKTLARLASRQDIGADVTDSWRNGLLWMGADVAENKPLFQAYLAQHPDDQAVRTALESGAVGTYAGNGRRGNAPAWRQDPRLSRGFAALKQHDLAAAEVAFQEKLNATPNDADALGGLGLVRLQQNQFDQAQELLGRAAARPGAGPDWRRAAVSARYWSLLNQADQARLKGDKPAAQDLIGQAIRVDARPAAAHNAIARMLANEGDLVAAEKQYRKVLAQHRSDGEALRGMIDLLAQTNRIDQAYALIDGLSQEQRAELGDLSRMKASALATESKKVEKQGDRAGARALLEQANATDPNNPWLTYELARLLSRTGNRGQAQTLMENMLSANADSADANYAASLLAAEQGDWAHAYYLLSRVPNSRRNAEIDVFQRRVWQNEQISQANRMAQLGDAEPARRQLAKLQAQAGQDPQLLGAIAQAYVDNGEKDRAIEIMRPLVGNTQTASPDVLLPYANVLLKSGEDAQVASILRQLQNMPLTPDQHRSFQDLVSLYTVQQSERALARRDLTTAYDLLRPVLQRRPDDAMAQGTLARMYATSGQTDRALDIYRSLQARDPGNAKLQMSVASIASGANDWRSAEQAITQALDVAPDDPEVLASAARLYRDNGRTGRAAELYQRAIAIEQERQDAMKMVALARPGAKSNLDNPFVGLPAQRVASAQNATDLSDLLDGGDSQSSVVFEPLLASASTESSPFSSVSDPANAPLVAAAQPGQAATNLRNELAEVMEERSPEVRAGVFVRSNNGEKGLSKMTQVDAPIEVRLPLGDGKVSLRATPVSVNAGSLGDSDSRTSRFGAGPEAVALQKQKGLTGGAGPQRDKGVGLSAGYETKGFKADIGVTPLGFEYTNIVGGARVNGSINPATGTWYDVNVSRREVTDSVVSFAGAKDERTGQRWGAVTSNGVSASVGADKEDYGVYAYGSWHKLVGNNVKTNSRTEVGTGIYKNLVNKPDKKLTAGVNLGANFYDNNQRFFTYGHGGYFSPQQYYELSLPVTWAQRSGNFNYKLQASAGLRHFKEDDADYFPNNSGMQAGAAQILGGSAKYKGQSRTGVGYNMSAAGEYKLNNHLSLGGTVGMDNSSDYRQYAGGLYLRYSFQPVTRPPEVPLKPYQSPYTR